MVLEGKRQQENWDLPVEPKSLQTLYKSHPEVQPEKINKLPERSPLLPPQMMPLNKLAEWAVMTGPDPLIFSEACFTKAVQGGAVGALFGVAFGAIMGSYSAITPPVTMPGVPDPPKIPITYQMKEAWRATARSCRGSAKNFGVLVCLISGIECTIEKMRATTDMENKVAAGCIAGGIIASPGGPGAACFGCAGFAAFTVAIEAIMG